MTERKLGWSTVNVITSALKFFYGEAPGPHDIGGLVEPAATQPECAHQHGWHNRAPAPLRLSGPRLTPARIRPPLGYHQRANGPRSRIFSPILPKSHLSARATLHLQTGFLRTHIVCFCQCGASATHCWSCSSSVRNPYFKPWPMSPYIAGRSPVWGEGDGPPTTRTDATGANVRRRGANVAASESPLSKR